jgi:hypothetical protein
VGLAGSLYGQLARQITLSSFTGFSPHKWFGDCVGWYAAFSGTNLGCVRVRGLDEFPSMDRWALGLRILLIVVVFVFPRGIAGAVTALCRW